MLATKRLILIFLSTALTLAMVKAYEEKVSCTVSMNEEFGKVCRVENVNHQTMNKMEIDAKSFKYVFFHNSNIKFFTNEFVERLGKIKYLNVNEVGLEHIDGNVLGKLSGLLIFWGSQNELTNLDAGAFSDNRNLELICLKFNKINYIHPYALFGLSNLKSLDLSSNKLKSMEKIFNSLSNLVSLDLSSNLLETLDDEIFEKLKNLKQLSLSKNNLKSLNAEAFDALKSLEYIDLSFNKLEKISKRILKHNKNLNKIIMNGNKIKSIELKFFTNAKPKLNLILLRMNVCTNDDLTTQNGIISQNQLLKFNLCFENFNEHLKIE